jgi:RNase P subunit RPR2
MTTAVDAAQYLADNIHTIARHPNAGDCYADIEHLVRKIENAINRPTPPRFLGPCPTLIEHHRACAMRLTAPRDATHVTCRACGTEHDIDRLIEQTLSETADYLLTIPEIALVLRRLGETVPIRTLYDWVTKGKLTPRNPRVATRKYRLSDARALARKSQRAS